MIKIQAAMLLHVLFIVHVETGSTCEAKVLSTEALGIGVLCVHDRPPTTSYNYSK